MTARATLGTGVALLFAGLAFDSPSLEVPGLAMAILSLGLRAWVRLAARGTRVERLPGPWSVVEGERYPLAVRIVSGRPRPPGGWLLEPLLPEPRALGMSLPGQVYVDVRFERRGRKRLEPATLRVGDPLGLCAADVRSEEEAEVLVLPRVEPVIAYGGRGGGAADESSDGSRRGIGGAGLDSGVIDFEVDGLRPYREGSPAARIHWPTVARTGELLELRLVTGGQASPLVVVDAADPVDEERLDRVVRAAASLCFHLARAGGCAALLPGERRPLEVDPALRAWPEVHAALALLEAGGAPPARRWARGAAVFWVTARAKPILPQALGRRGAGTGFLVTPEPIRGFASMFEVAGCHGQRLESARHVDALRATAA